MDWLDIEVRIEKLKPFLDGLFPGMTILERDGVHIFPIQNPDTGEITRDSIAFLDYPQPENGNYRFGFDPTAGPIEEQVFKAAHDFKDHLIYPA